MQNIGHLLLNLKESNIEIIDSIDSSTDDEGNVFYFVTVKPLIQNALIVIL